MKCFCKKYFRKTLPVISCSQEAYQIFDLLVYYETISEFGCK